MLPFVVNVDFEEDQWTFFKPSHDELRALYGVKVHELTVWRPLLEHVVEHLAVGRLVSIEVDAFWLADTAGTDYRYKHSKTTIAINHIDVSKQQMAYFHNAGYFVAEGEDFQQLLKLQPNPEPAFELPLFAELISFLPTPPLTLAQTQALSLQLMRKQMSERLQSNPVERFALRFAQDLPLLQARGLDYYHAWAFAGIRQWGAAFELAAAWLDWMQDALGPNSVKAKNAFNQMSQDAKTLILKGARAVASKKPLDPVSQLTATAALWPQAMESLALALGQN
jgi:hypothetical protein